MSYGGGFLAGSQASNSSPNGGGGKKSGSTALRPVTIHQVLSADQAFGDAEFMIDGQEAKEITLVACIRSVNQTTTQATFLIEDGTGQIDCRMWIESGDASGEVDPRIAALENNHYVRIIGSIKTFAEKRHINAQRVRAIEDFNEISFHLIETAYVHKYITLGAPGGGDVNMVTDRPYDGNGANPYTVDNGGGGGGVSIPSDLPQGSRTILKFLKEQEANGMAGDEGVHIDAIKRHLGNGVSQEKCRDMCQQLLDDGLLYTTLDDEHWLCT